MNWGSATEFFAMGGYGLYVWGSYVVAMICFVGEFWLLKRRQRATVQDMATQNE
jgi:heme exporter protein D